MVSLRLGGMLLRVANHTSEALACVPAIGRTHPLCMAQVLTDDHLSTRFAWARPHTLSSESTAAISWDIPASVQPGGWRHQRVALVASLCGGTSDGITLTIAPCGMQHALACRQAACARTKQLVTCQLVAVQPQLMSGCWLPAGVYRLRHFGDYKHILGGTQAFEGASRSFCVALSARSCLIRRAWLGLLLALRTDRLWRLV